MRSDADFTELGGLLTLLCDGEFGPSELDRLERILLDDPDAQRYYARFLALDEELAWSVVGPPQPAIFKPRLPVLSPSDLGVQTSSSPPLTFLGNAIHGTVGFFSSDWPMAYLVATVIFGIGLLIGSLVHVSEPVQVVRQSVPLPSPLGPLPTMVGRITGMVDCQFDRPKSQDPRPKTLVCLGDRFILSSGLMEITYDTGAKVILQGPVTYEVESAAGGFLSAGKLTARVENAKQQPAISKSPNLQISKLFVVRTPTATVTDLGTEFGVEVGKEGRTEVHVLQGLVEARPAGFRGVARPAQRVVEGCAVEIMAKADQFKTVAFAPRSFIRTLQPPTDTPSETAYIRAVLADKPMGYWPLNEPAGARRFFDRSGHGVHGYATGKVLAGQPDPLPGDSHGIRLDGNGYIDLGIRNQFAMKNDFTVEAWVSIGNVKQCSKIISVLGQSGGSSHVGWALGAGPVAFGCKDDAEKPLVLYFTTPGSGPTDFFLYRFSRQELGNRWCHVAMVFDGDDTARLYLNGEPCGSVVKGKPANVGTVWLMIGCGDVGADLDFWRGRLAHVAVYPRVLSAQQIQNHYGEAFHPNATDNRKETP